MRTSILFIISFVSVIPLWSHPTAIDHDGMLLVNGERRFVLGLYQQAQDDAFAKEVAEAGFNLIRCGLSLEELDRAEQAGLMAWISPPGWNIGTTEQEEAFKANIDAFKTHPALSVWEGPDEALWNIWWVRWNTALARWSEVDKAIQSWNGEAGQKETLAKQYKRMRALANRALFAEAEEIETELRARLQLEPKEKNLSGWYQHVEPLKHELQTGSRMVRKTDPDHVIWFNHAPRNTLDDLALFGTVADVVGCDIYPVPFGPLVGHSDLRERNLACVGAYTKQMAQSAPGKPVWMVLQGFGWDDLGEGSAGTERPRPTYEQTRFMAYDAIVNGARGILYWGTFTLNAESEFRRDLKKVISELKEYQPFLSARDKRLKLKPHPRWGSSEKGLVMLAKQAGDRWGIFLVNEADEPIAFDLGGLKSCSRLRDSTTGEILEVQEGQITYGVPGGGVTILVSP